MKPVQDRSPENKK